MSAELPTRIERLPKDHRRALPDPRRATPERLAREIRAISESPVVTAVLDVADAVLLVLNAERQIVGFNSRVADVRAPEDVLGLRPGEAFGCVNSRGPGGCGAALACASCGALGAILGCQERGRPLEAECLLRTGDQVKSLEFNVRASPVTLEDARFTVVSFRDISGEKRREVLEQVFFHDVLNTVGGLRGWAQLLQRGADVARASQRIEFLTRHVEREIRDHRNLLLAENGALVPERTALQVGELLNDVATVFSGHPAARERRLEVAASEEDLELVSDRSLLLRVIVNMVRNALEATAEGGVVRVWWERDPDDGVRVLVHNAGAMPPEVQARVFQRSFSTKAERGRGLGTYAMKLFGEGYLRGQVSFRSAAHDGTTFSVRLPLAPASC